MDGDMTSKFPKCLLSIQWLYLDVGGQNTQIIDLQYHLLRH